MPFVNTERERENLRNLSKGMQATAEQINDLVTILENCKAIESDAERAFDEVRRQVEQISKKARFIQEQ